MKNAVKWGVLIITLSFILGRTHECYADQQKDSPEELYLISSKNLNYSSSFSNDSIIALSSRIEDVARERKDYNTMFRAGQIKVNAYCLKGDIGLAIDKASQIYEQAKALDSKLGTALALQSLGDTYMFSNRFTQADSAFSEAEQELSLVHNDIVAIRLFLQHIHICVKLQQPEKADNYLKKLEPLIENDSSEEKENYYFRYLYYKLANSLVKGDMAIIDSIYNQLTEFKSRHDEFNHLYYIISAYYYMIKGNDSNALRFSDSTLSIARRTDDMHNYARVLSSKASVLEQMKRYGDAYIVYKEVNDLNDSLNMDKYANQLDELHVSYWVDKLQLETAAKYNRFLTWIILFSLLILGTVAAVIIIIRRKNKTLKLSYAHLASESERAAKSINSKSLFLSNMSHEIRTPLNGIVGFSQLLATCTDIDEETKRQCEDSIRQNSDLLLKLIKDVTDLSDLEDDQMVFTFGSYDAVTICRNVIQTIDTVKNTSAELIFASPLDNLELYTDSERLQQVLINLLMNAAKFTPSGYIKLSLSIHDKVAFFSVEDTGCGIPLDKQPYIFQRFEKLHESAQGSGLGLSICQLIVEHLGGEIWIDSEYTGGAKFVFTHPLAKQQL